VEQNNYMLFPRKLRTQEKEWLFTALPENKLGYMQYREIIDGLTVIGFGRFGDGNLILGTEGEIIDLEVSSAPIFAVSNISFEKANVYVTIHEELERQIEIDLKIDNEKNIPDNLNQSKIWTYSNWIPGEKAPHDNSRVREVHLVKNEIVLAIAPIHKKIWVYNSRSGINHFVPVTNFYNEMILLTEIKDPVIALNPGRLFTNLDEFTDEQLATGFFTYNRHWKRVELDYHITELKNEKKKKSFLDLFKQ
jgi:hypothetical protein